MDALELDVREGRLDQDRCGLGLVMDEPLERGDRGSDLLGGRWDEASKT
jgi:hypothetical protein